VEVLFHPRSVFPTEDFSPSQSEPTRIILILIVVVRTVLIDMACLVFARDFRARGFVRYFLSLCRSKKIRLVRLLFPDFLFTLL